MSLSSRFQKISFLQRPTSLIRFGYLEAVCFWLFVSILLLGSLGLLAGIRVNLSESAPIGVWKEMSGFKKGDYVLVCLLKERVGVSYQRYLSPGSCFSGHVPLLKKIVAIEGDQVKLKGIKVWVNGVRLQEEKFNKPLPCRQINQNATYHLKNGEYFVLNTKHPCSLDSKYFGKVLKEEIISGVKPLLIFKH